MESAARTGSSRGSGAPKRPIFQGQWSMVQGQTGSAIVECCSGLLNAWTSFVPASPFGGLVSSYAASGQVAPDCAFPGSSGKLACSSCTAGRHSSTAPLTRLCCIGCVGTYLTAENNARSSPVAFRSSCDTDASAIVHTNSDQTILHRTSDIYFLPFVALKHELNSSNPPRLPPSASSPSIDSGTRQNLTNGAARLARRPHRRPHLLRRSSSATTTLLLIRTPWHFHPFLQAASKGAFASAAPRRGTPASYTMPPTAKVRSLLETPRRPSLHCLISNLLTTPPSQLPHR